MSLVLRVLRSRVERNQNAIVFIVGSTGSGKSYASLKLGEILDPNFSLDNVCFSFEAVLERIESKKLKPGAVVIFEEVGINIDARNWYDKVNKNMAYVLESFRTDRLIFIMNVPDQTFADKKARKLAHTIIEMSHVDYVHKQGVAKVKWIQNNPLSGKTYYKPTRGVINDNYCMIRSTRFPKPSTRLCNRYEKKRAEFLKQVKENAKEAMEEKEKPKKHIKTTQEIITDLKKEFGSIVKVKEYLTNINGNTPIRHIMSLLNVSESKAYAIKDYIHKATA